LKDEFILLSERPAVENIPQSGGEAQNGLSASVPRRGAPPPPPSDARDCTFDLPKNLIIYPIQDEMQGLMLNLFYRIGLYEDAQFLLPKVLFFKKGFSYKLVFLNRQWQTST
jgi:hypothetical protein